MIICLLIDRTESIPYRYSALSALSIRIMMEFPYLSPPNILAPRDWNVAVTANQMERDPIGHVILLMDMILRRLNYLPSSETQWPRRISFSAAATDW